MLTGINELFMKKTALLLACVLHVVGMQALSFTIVRSTAVNDTLSIAVTDLQRYIEQTVPDAEVTISDKAGSGHTIVVVEPTDASHQRLCKQYGVKAAPTAWNSFRITSFRRKDDRRHNIYFLEGADIWGRQYAIYDLAERLLGVRYLKPELDHIVVQKDFKAGLINTGIEQPDYKWRGLYPWHYNYNSRGLTTFCDINAHFVKKDWAWFRQLADWMIKNKQNAVLWFDDVFAHENISGQFPDHLVDYMALRGIRQVLGMGWASNEDLTTGGKWKRKYCLNSEGHSVEDAGWKRAICPMRPEYFQLAEINFGNMTLTKPENYLGVLMGYGENSWAALEKGVPCTLHDGVPSSQMMVRDLKWMKKKFESVGLGNLPMGFVTSTYAIRPGNPFETDYLIDHMPANGIFTMHTYQQSGWRQDERLYQKIAERNRRDGTNIKVFHIAEVAFICNDEIPLLKPSILRRRSEHYNTLPRENTIGHLATLNTTQYLYWYKTYQLMRWQWHKDDSRWDEDNLQNFTAIFGRSQAEKLNEIVNRLTCLEYVLPYTAIDSLRTSKPELLPPPQWSRYNPTTHPDKSGFLLWANTNDLQALNDAEQSIARIQALNNELAATADPLYCAEFEKTIRLTALYYDIRVAIGQQRYYQQQGDTAQTEAKRQHALAALDAYDPLFLSLLNLKEPLSRDNIDDIRRDFVINPSRAYLNSK